MVEAAGSMEGVRLVIGGSGQLAEEVEAMSQSFPNVDFVGRIPRERVIPFTFESSAVVLMVSPSARNNSIALGNKQFEAMVCGRPIICTRGTYSGEFTEKENIGLVCPYTIEGFRDAVIRLRDHPELQEQLGRRALKAAVDKYNWDIEKKRLVRLVRELGNGK
jgi:glycosyltransferase involved in cell wall biosynthesis